MHATAIVLLYVPSLPHPGLTQLHYCSKDNG